MPQSSANLPESQPSIDRLTLAAQSVRGNGASVSVPWCMGSPACSCFEAQAQGVPGIGGPMCVSLDCEPSVMGALCPFCFEGDAE